MWEIIKPHYDFNRKVVVDLGCGKGDMCGYVMDAGAQYILGVDRDSNELETTKAKCYGKHGLFDLLCLDLNNPFEVITEVWRAIPEARVGGTLIDVGFFTSVMPYLDDPVAKLHAYMAAFKVMFIEVQYFGDGPGLACIKTDDDMRKIITCVNRKVRAEPLGRTLVVGRNAYRTIWKYTNIA